MHGVYSKLADLIYLCVSLLRLDDTCIRHWIWPPLISAMGLFPDTKLRVAHAPGMLGTFSPPPRVSDPDMHHGTCMPKSLISSLFWSRWRGNFRGACATRNLAYLVRGPWFVAFSLSSHSLSQYRFFYLDNKNAVSCESKCNIVIILKRHYTGFNISAN